jgi:hypothetical protein
MAWFGPIGPKPLIRHADLTWWHTAHHASQSYTNKLSQNCQTGFVLARNAMEQIFFNAGLARLLTT